MHFVDNIEYLRSFEGNLSEEKFGELFDFTKGKSNSVFSGRTNPSIDFLIALKEKYLLSIDSLLLEDFKNSKPLHKHAVQEFYIPPSEYVIRDHTQPLAATEKEPKPYKTAKTPKKFTENLLNSLLYNDDVKLLVAEIIKSKL